MKLKEFFYYISFISINRFVRNNASRILNLVKYPTIEASDLESDLNSRQS